MTSISITTPPQPDSTRPASMPVKPSAMAESNAPAVISTIDPRSTGRSPMRLASSPPGTVRKMPGIMKAPISMPISA